MSTFATAQDVANYIEGWQTDDPFALERLILKAETDVNRVLVSYRYQPPPTQVIFMPGAQGGTFDLHWNGANPEFITEQWNASAAKIQTDLQGITDIGLGNVTVLGTGPYTLLWNYAWTETYANNVIPVVSIDTTNLQPGGIVPTVLEVEGRKINPLTDLNRNQALALSRSTCAQVEFRNQMGPAYFVKPQYQNVQGPDFTTSGKLPYIGPKAKMELAQTGLLFAQGRAVAGYGRRGVQRGWATY